MDPLIIGLAAKAVGILSPYVAKSGEEFAKGVGKAAYDRSKTLLETLKKRFLGDEEATETLENFEQKPQRYKPVLESILTEKLEKDKAFADEIQKLLDDIGPQIEIILKMTDAEKAIGLDSDEMTRGKVKIDMTIDHGKDITGARIKKIG